MMKKTILLSVLALVLSFSQVSANAEFEAAWKAADEKRMEAAAVGYEWRDTKKFLKQAKEAAEQGDLDKAMKLVAKAHEQSEDAITQQAREVHLWSSRVIR